LIEIKPKKSLWILVAICPFGESVHNFSDLPSERKISIEKSGISSHVQPRLITRGAHPLSDQENTEPARFEPGDLLSCEAPEIWSRALSEN